MVEFLVGGVLVFFDQLLLFGLGVDVADEGLTQPTFDYALLQFLGEEVGQEVSAPLHGVVGRLYLTETTALQRFLHPRPVQRVLVPV